MSQRLPMNSGALQENFPEVYGEFFSKCELVVSAPGSFYWFGDHADRYGELAVKQKIPLRAYVGLEASDEPTWALADGMFFVPSERKFRRFSRYMPRNKRLLQLLGDFARTLGMKSPYRVHTLTEIPIDCGLSSWAAVSAALSLALHLKTEKVSAADVERWNSTPLEQLTIAGSPFDQVFKMAWKLELIFNADSSAGAGVFAAMVSSTFPVMYMTEKRVDAQSARASNRMPTDFGDDYHQLDRVKYWGFRLQEFFGLRNAENWPLDFGLLYAGSTTSAEFIIRSANDAQLALQDATESFAEIARQKIPDHHGTLPPFLMRTREGTKSAAWDAALAALGNTSIEGAIAFRQIFDRGYTEKAIDDLFEAIYRYNSFLSVFGVTTPTLRSIRHYLKKAATKEETTLASKITGAGRGGDILFATPLHTFEHSMDGVLTMLCKKVDPRIWLDYASWLDGYEERGVMVEQNFQGGRYSRFVSAGAVVVRTWKSNKSFLQIVSTDRLESSRKTFDLFLDPGDRMIYLRGKPLTSKELHSRKVTTAILRVLLDHLGKTVSSQYLPASSYIDRTAMQGKIIGPLREIFEARTGKKLPLSISGGLRKNFTVRLEPSDLTIGMIEKKV